MSAVWATSELPQARPPQRHSPTNTLPLLSRLHIWSERGRKWGRETSFHLRDKWFLLDILLMLIWENPHPSHHTHLLICTKHTRIHTHFQSHVNKCGDSRRRHCSRSEPHLLPDLPRTHAQTHSYCICPNQTWPGLSSSHSLRSTYTRAHICAHKV